MIAPPRLPPPGPDDHKYTRGLVAVVAGEMPGAAALAALGAARSGAGYIQLVSPERISGLPHAIVQRAEADLADPRIGAIVVGPGLGGRLERARPALSSGRPLVLDADALPVLTRATAPTILTPHEGEFARRWPGLAGSREERATAAARETGAVVVLKGAQTVVAAPDGRTAVAAPASHALATAGTGDVLAGIAGTMLAQLGDPFAAAQAAAWLHAQAARACPAPFLADDLAAYLPTAVRSCWCE